jgi:uncharacterized protein (TIGR02265 family)
MEASPPENVKEQVNAAVFEGMFVRALNADGEFKEALLQVGVDLDHLEVQYPVTTWFAALDLASRRLHPTLPREDAHRELGRTFIDGYARTLVGTVLLAAAQVIGPARLVARMPRMLNTARPSGIQASAREVGSNAWVLDVKDRFAVPGFHAGMVEKALTFTKVSATVEIEARTPEGFSLSIRW